MKQAIDVSQLKVDPATRQLITAAAVVNLLNFSFRIAPQDMGIRVFLLLGLMVYYLMEFTVLYYIYANTENLGREAVITGHGLFSCSKSDWWGEDRV